MDPVLLFGIGATKAGTSWLHRYLSDHPDCHFRAIKELHYFDAFDFGELDRQKAHIEGMKADLVGRTDIDNDLRLANVLRQLGHIEHWLTVLAKGREDSKAYLGYLTGGREEEKVVGDITPAYSLLSEERLRHMAGLMADTRFIYLMRDPVGRLWSHVRMMAKRRSDGGETVADRAAHIFGRWLKGEEHQLDIRSDYAAALTKLNRAVAEEKRLVMFYEDLFTDAGVNRVCGFLGLDPVPGRFDLRVLEGEKLSLPPEDRARAREKLSDQYDKVAEVMGALPETWRQAEKV